MAEEFKPARWTISMASKDFDVDPKTLSKYLHSAGIVAGSDGMFSTMEICHARFGDIDASLKRATTADKEAATRLKGIEERKALREFLPADLVERVWSGVLLDLRQKISQAEISDRVKHELSRDLMAIPIEEYFKDSKPSDEESDEP